MSARNLPILALGVTLLGVVFIGSNLDGLSIPSAAASHLAGPDAFAIDMDPSASPANTGTTIGTVEGCARVNENDFLDADEDSADTLNVDVLIDTTGNPVIATAFVFNFPGGGTEFTVAQITTPWGIASGWNIINTSDPPQDDGTFQHGVTDLFSTGTVGSGTLADLTMETKSGVSTGTFPLTLTQAAIVDTGGTAQVPDSLVNAVVSVNEPCPLPPADVEIVSLSLTSISGPSVNANTNFDLEAVATATNNGPNPADIEIDIDLSIPADCTRIPNSNQTESFLNVPSGQSRISTRTWTVNCTLASDHAFSASASVAVTGLADESAPGNNGPINQQVNVAILDTADAKVSSVSVTATASANVNTPFDVTVTATLHNNGPVTPVNADTTLSLAVPADCVPTAPPGSQTVEDTSLVQSNSSNVQATWSVQCSTHSSHQFTGSAAVAIDQLHVSDPTPANNSGNGNGNTAITATTDLKVTGVTTTAPVSANAGVTFQVTVDAVLHNNGPVTPVNADATIALSVPGDCSATPTGGQDQQDIPLAQSAAGNIQATWDVSCTDFSNHQFDGNATVAVDELHVSDATSGNDSNNGSDTTSIFDSADIKVSSVTTGVPVSADANTPFDVTVDTTVHNNGPVDPAPVDVEITLNLPPDCTTPTNPVTVPAVLALSVATALPTETFPVTCTDRSSHNFDSTVTLLHPLHLNDPTPGNDSATSANQVVPISDLSDLKLSAVFVNGVPQPLVDTAFDVTATNVVHNNGPSGPANADVTTTLNLPPDCSTSDANPQTAEDTALATSTSAPVDIVWSVTCSSHSFHSFIADSTIALDDGLHVRDPNSGNDSASSNNTVIPVFAQADGKIVSAIAVNPPTEITGNTNVNITIRKELHNNGPFGATDFDLSKSITPPPGCTVTPPPTTSHTLAVSSTVIVDEVWVINCQPGSYSLSFNNSLAPTELHVIEAAAGNNNSSVGLDFFVDTDGDNFPDDVEVACGSNPNDSGSIPERVDGIFAGVDDDGNDGADEALPPGAAAFDCDGDGYPGTAEDNVYSYIPQTDGDQKTCQEYDLTHPNPNADIKPSLRWPSDLNMAVFPLDSFNKITILDITSFLVPVKYFETNVGTSPGDVRWDLTPGAGVFLTDINIQDITAMIAGSSGNPPMLGGAKAFDGPVCPFAP